MLPSKSLYGNNKKYTSDSDPYQLPPPPPYSEYSSGSNYGGYHERTPTAPPASLLTEEPPLNTNPDWPNYGSAEHQIPDAEENTPPPPPPSNFYQKLSNNVKSNRYVKAILQFNYRQALFMLFCFTMTVLTMLHETNDDRKLGSPSQVVMMTSPYPLTPTHETYAKNMTKDMTDLPVSTLTTLAIDFGFHPGELHLVPTQDPVSWLSFSSPNSIDSLTTEFNLRNPKSLDIRLKGDCRLVAVLHVSPHDRQQAQIILKVNTMMVYAVTEEPANMIQDLDITLGGSRLGLSLPRVWKGKNMRVKLEGNNGSFGVARMEASGTIELALTGMAGGDLALQEPMMAKHIKLSSRNGRISGTTMVADTIDLTTTNSQLSVNSLQARHSCNLRTTNGRIDVRLDGSDLDRLDVTTENSAIHLLAKPLIRRASVTSNLGSITMHATQAFDGLFDIQSALSKTTIEDNQVGQIHLDVSGANIKQGHRGIGSGDHQIKLFSYAGSTRLAFNQ